MTIVIDGEIKSADHLRHANKDGLLQFTASYELTIASGAITLTDASSNVVRVDTESDASSDNLDTINKATNMDANFPIFLRPDNDARTIVIKHDTGNISCVTQADITLDDVEDFAIIYYDNTLGRWLALSMAGEGLSLSDATPIVEAVTGAAGSSANASRADHVHPLVAAAAGGKILQVVSVGDTSVETDTGSGGSDATYSLMGALTLAITLADDTNKVLVIASLQVSGTSSSRGGIRLRRASSDIMQGASAGSRETVSAGIVSVNTNNSMPNVGLTYLDSPATAGSVTYEVYWASFDGVSYYNRSKDDGDTNSNPRTMSTLTLLEIDV